MQEDYNSESFLRRLKLYLFIFVLMIGFSHTWAVRDSVDPDGVSYLDVGNAYFNGNYSGAINANGYWSPFYPLIQGLSNYLFNPSIDSESLFIHLVNFVIYIFSFLAFKFFFAQLMSKIDTENKELTTLNLVTFPKWAWITIGHFLFIWSSMNLITISKVTPDMCVSVFIYLISGLLLKISNNKTSIIDFIFFGLFLALSYFSKAAMLLIALIYVLVLFFMTIRQKSNLLKPLIALVVFLLVSAPYISELSKAKGHFTFSETGKLVYSFRMEDTYFCWMGGLKGCNGVLHPAKKIFDKPNTYEFGSPIIGSYPIWFDPTYWYGGLSANFNLIKQLKILVKSFERGLDLFIEMQGFLIASFSILLIYSSLKFKDICKLWFLIVPSFFTIFMYSLIDLQNRYLGAFICILWISLFYSIKLKNTDESKKLLNSVSVVLILFFMINSIKICH